MDQTVACSLRFSSPLSSGILPPLLSAGQTRLNPGSLGGQTASLPRGSTQNAFQRVHLILLLCVFVYLTAELPLTVSYLSSPLRKLLQYLWFLCNKECVCARACVYAGFWQIQFPLDNFLFYEIHPILFSSVALYSPSQGFITKQVIHIHTDKWDDGVGKVRCILCLLSLHFLFLTMLLPVVTLQIIQMRYARFPYQRPGKLDTAQALKFFCITSSNSVSKAASLFAYDPTVTWRLLPITCLLFYDPFTPVTSALNLENDRGQLPVN